MVNAASGNDATGEHLIRDDADYQAHIDYVHINPLKHGLVPRVRDWPYSTFHRLVQQGVYPHDWRVVMRQRLITVINMRRNALRLLRPTPLMHSLANNLHLRICYNYHN